MSKARVIVLQVVQQGLSKAEVARRHGVSWRWVHTLVQRYEADGLEGLEPRSRRPASSPQATPQPVVDRILALRRELTVAGLDAGPETIATHLARERGARPPSTSTIRRILIAADLVVPDPSKRPRSAVRRFEADQPNECWQSDFTHWRLADGSDVEILNWLDDHARLLLSCTVHDRVTGPIVITSFTTTAARYGLPASTLTDNGSVYTSRFTGGRNGFEYLLALHGITQKNGHPGHAQTQGKIERFHQTLKKWLTAQPPAQTLVQLQQQLDTFRTLYNTRRPHRALGRRTPQETYDATIKATPTNATADTHFRVRSDHVDRFGKLTLRRAGTLHHLGIGAHRAGQPVLLLIEATTVTVIHQTSGEVLSEHTIDPDRPYWRNTRKNPGRWPELP